MKFCKIENQTILSDKNISVGEELTVNTTDGAYDEYVCL